jgi:DNA-3-methyladenine glycosylase I
MEEKRTLTRCPWVDLSKPDYVEYHDREWGVPLHEDRALFEFLTLESAQAGLSWYTVLRKREGYRQAFAGFDAEKVARFGARQIEARMKDTAIIRNRAKIEATVKNARALLALQEEMGSFAKYQWGFVDGATKQNRWKSPKEIPAETPESKAMAKDMKKRGFSFFGPVVAYAHMQATGMVNDHVTECFRHRALR